MPGNPSTQRTHAAAINAFRLRQQGLTNKQIAAQLGKDVDRIPTMVALGERLSQGKFSGEGKS